MSNPYFVVTLRRGRGSASSFFSNAESSSQGLHEILRLSSGPTGRIIYCYAPFFPSLMSIKIQSLAHIAPENHDVGFLGYQSKSEETGFRFCFPRRSARDRSRISPPRPYDPVRKKTGPFGLPRTGAMYFPASLRIRYRVPRDRPQICSADIVHMRKMPSAQSSIFFMILE